MSVAAVGVVAILLSLAAAVHGFCKLSGCANPATDCDTCIIDVVDTHHTVLSDSSELFPGTPPYNCTAGSCFLDQTLLTALARSQCNDRSNICCLPTNPTTDFLCPTKKCFQSTGCDVLGFCNYDLGTPVRTGCCQTAADCPDTSTDTPTAFDLACSVPSCDAFSDCNYDARDFCCVSDSDCPASAPITLGSCGVSICNADPALPGEKTCEYRVSATCSCSSAADCNDGNACTTDSCSSGFCASAFSGLSGCCQTSAAECTSTTCATATGCDNAVTVDGGRSDSYVPTFTCIVDDTSADACCTQDGDCAFFAEQIECIDSIGVCDGSVDKCLLNADGYSNLALPCCYTVDDCIPDFGIINDRCVWFGCTGGLSDTVSYDTAFQCTPHTISPCNPTALPNGLEPTLTISAPFERQCAYLCGDADQNTASYSATISNPSPASPEMPLYNYTIEVVTDNHASFQSVQSITLEPLDLLPDTGRSVPALLFDTNGPPTVSFGVFTQSFLLTSPLPLFPGEALKVQVTFTFDNAVSFSSISSYVRVVPYDICDPFFIQTPTSSCMETGQYGNTITRTTQSGTNYNFVFDGGVCGVVCPPITTTGGTTPAPTPASTTAVQAAVDISLLSVPPPSCLWNCADGNDPTRNSVQFSIVRTNPGFAGPSLDFDTYAVHVQGYAGTTPLGSLAYASNLLLPSFNYTLQPTIVGSDYSYSIPGVAPIEAGGADSTNFQVFLASYAAGSGLTKIVVTFTGTAHFTCTQLLINAGYCSTVGASGSYTSNTVTEVAVFDGVTCGVPCSVLPETNTNSFNWAMHGELAGVWTCDDPVTAQNLVRITFYVTNNEPVSTNSRYLSLVYPAGYITSVPTGEAVDVVYDTVLLTSASGVNYTNHDDPRNSDSALYLNFPHDFLGLSTSPAIVPPATTLTFSLSFYVSPARILESGDGVYVSFSVYAGHVCGIMDAEAGNCPWYFAPYGFTSLTASTSVFPFAAEYGTDISEPCVPTPFLPGTIGGYVWLDANRDGVRDVTETPVSNVRVLMTLPSSQTDFATTLSDVSGRYTFYALPSETFYLRLYQASIPYGLLSEPISSHSSPYYANFFAGTPPRTANFAVQPIYNFINAGLVTTPPCVPPAPPTGTPTGGLVLLAGSPSSIVCSGCVGQQTPASKCTPQRCARTLSYNSVELRYAISNYGPFAAGPGSLSIRLHPLATSGDPITLDDSDGASELIVCADATLVSATNARLLRTREAAYTGAYKREAAIELAWSQLDLAVDAATFTVRFSYCSDIDMPRFNVTARLFGDQCTDTVNAWRRCDTSGPDIRSCYNEQIVDTSTLTCPACPATSSHAPHTPAPPVGTTSALAASTGGFCYPPTCVNNLALTALHCADQDKARDQCLHASRRGVSFVSAQVFNPLATTSEGGQFLATFARFATGDTASRFEVCDANATALPWFVSLSAPTAANARVVSVNQNVAAQNVSMIITFDTIPPLSSIMVSLETLECYNSTTNVTLQATARVRTGLCSDLAGCSSVRSSSRQAIQSCLSSSTPCPDFQSNVYLGSVGSAGLSENLDKSGSIATYIAISVLIVGVLGGIVLCIFAGYRQRKRKSKV